MRSTKTKLTKRLVESVKPNDRDIFVWDAEVPGFGLRVWPSGKRVFIYQYRTKHGHTRRPLIGRYGSITVEQARRTARQWAADIQKGGDPGGERREARNAPTVAQLAVRYMAEHARLKKKPRSVTSDETLLRLHILPTIGHRKVESVTRADVQRLHHGMNATPGAANRTIALLSKMFNLAENWALRPDGSNPCRHVEKFKEHKLERFLSETELARLAETLVEAEQARIELPSVIAAIRLLLFTGARLSEILTVRWEHVNFEEHCLRLPDSKTGAKTIYLSPPALEVLNDLQRQDGNPYVIIGAKPGAHLINLRKPWHRIRTKAGLDNVRIHDLRHSFASMAVAGGLSLPVIGALLGHTQASTTQRYAHLAADPLKQAANLTGARITAAMNQGALSQGKIKADS
jgi:integrase